MEKNGAPLKSLRMMVNSLTEKMRNGDYVLRSVRKKVI